MSGPHQASEAPLLFGQRRTQFHGIVVSQRFIVFGGLILVACVRLQHSVLGRSVIYGYAHIDAMICVHHKHRTYLINLGVCKLVNFSDHECPFFLRGAFPMVIPERAVVPTPHRLGMFHEASTYSSSPQLPGSPMASSQPCSTCPATSAIRDSRPHWREMADETTESALQPVALIREHACSFRERTQE